MTRTITALPIGFVLLFLVFAANSFANVLVDSQKTVLTTSPVDFEQSLYIKLDQHSCFQPGVCVNAQVLYGCAFASTSEAIDAIRCWASFSYVQSGRVQATSVQFDSDQISKDGHFEIRDRNAVLVGTVTNLLLTIDRVSIDVVDNIDDAVSTIRNIKPVTAAIIRFENKFTISEPNLYCHELPSFTAAEGSRAQSSCRNHFYQDAAAVEQGCAGGIFWSKWQCI